MDKNKLNPKYIYNRYREQILYIVFGIFTTAISIIVYAFFTELLETEELVSNLISWVIAVGFAFVTNRLYVFNSGTKEKSTWLREVFTFYAGRLLTLAIEEVLLWSLIKQLRLPNMPIKIAAQLIIIALNYIISKWLVFKK